MKIKKVFIRERLLSLLLLGIFLCGCNYNKNAVVDIPDKIQSESVDKALTKGNNQEMVQEPTINSSVNIINEDIWNVDNNTIVWAFFDSTAGNEEVEQRVNKKLEKDGYPFRLKCVVLGMNQYNRRVMECNADIVFDGMTFGEFDGSWSPAIEAITEGKFLKLDDYLKNSKLYDFYPEIMWDSIKYGDGIYTIPNTNFGDHNLAVVFKRGSYTDDEIISFDGTLDSLMDLLSNGRKLFFFGSGGWTGYLDLYGISNYEQYGIYFQNNEIKNIMSLNIVEDWIRKMHELAEKGTILRSDKISYLDCLEDWDIAIIDCPANTGLDEEKYVIKRYIGDMYPRFNGAIAIRSNSHNPDYAFRMMELFLTDSEYGNLIIYGENYSDTNGTAMDSITGNAVYSWNRRISWGVNDGLLKGSDLYMFDSPNDRKRYYKEYIRPANLSIFDYPDLAKETSKLYEKHNGIIFNFDNFEEELEEWITEADTAFKKFGPK